MYSETSSLIGCSAAELMDQSPGFDMDDRRAYQARYRKAHRTAPVRERRLPAPLPGDGVPKGACRRCGLVGEHETAAECINHLRDRLALFE